MNLDRFLSGQVARAGVNRGLSSIVSGQFNEIFSLVVRTRIREFGISSVSGDEKLGVGREEERSHFAFG
ncbi:hypothetical protein R1flu_023216 [Riccia fluitans]|uniref:Uncharacterized protein n=1 Tax=Riccia fluitans TaxID=41844 RepID=A0ABD1XRF5_9MARC